jgi:hypothetical protein
MLLIMSFSIVSCSMVERYRNFSFPWEKAAPKQDVLLLGKQSLQKRRYNEARTYFNQLIEDSPGSPKAAEAKFYILLLDFINAKKVPLNEPRYFSENPEAQLSYQFYAEIEAFLLSLIKQLDDERKVSKVFEETIKFKDENIAILKETIEELQKEKSKINKEIIEFNAILDEVKLENEKFRIQLEQQRDNYRKMQEIEMRKEKMEKEIRELSR